jgi:SAM-dependent methyltransferase
VATAQGRLPEALDDGLLGAHRRRLLHRAAGRVLDLSPRWEPNLAAYHHRAVTSVVVTGARRATDIDPEVPVPMVVPGLADAPEGAFDAVVMAFTLCTVDRPAQLLAAAAERLAPGGQLLVLQHVAGTGVTGLVQHLTNPLARALRTGCHFDLDVPAAARHAGLALVDCARFRLWVAAAVPVPGLAGVLVPTPRGDH